jgi:hypothetical protein
VKENCCKGWHGRAKGYYPHELILLCSRFLSWKTTDRVDVFSFCQPICQNVHRWTRSVPGCEATVLFLIRANGGKECFCPFLEVASRRNGCSGSTEPHELRPGATLTSGISECTFVVKDTVWEHDKIFRVVQRLLRGSSPKLFIRGPCELSARIFRGFFNGADKGSM